MAYGYARKTRPLFLVITVLILFACGGRTALYAATAAILLFELSRLTRKTSLWLIAYAAVIAVGIWFVSENFSVDVENRRATSMVFSTGIEDDNSYHARLEILRVAPEGFPSQFWIGDPGFIASRFSSMGDYIHNLLSVWQFFGFFAFAGFTFLLIRSLIKMFNARTNELDSALQGHSITLIYVVISVIFAKAVTFKLLWLTLGYWMLTPNASKGFPKVDRKHSKRKRRRRNRK